MQWPRQLRGGRDTLAPFRCPSPFLFSLLAFSPLTICMNILLFLIFTTLTGGAAGPARDDFCEQRAAGLCGSLTFLFVLFLCFMLFRAGPDAWPLAMPSPLRAVPVSVRGVHNSSPFFFYPSYCTHRDCKCRSRSDQSEAGRGRRAPGRRMTASGAPHRSFNLSVRLSDRTSQILYPYFLLMHRCSTTALH